jgi:hypothetical protein
MFPTTDNPRLTLLVVELVGRGEDSIIHLLEHPSPLIRLPSSQVSPASILLLPQTAGPL